MQSPTQSLRHTTELNISVYTDPSEAIWLHPKNLRLLQEAGVNLIVLPGRKVVLSLWSQLGKAIFLIFFFDLLEVYGDIETVSCLRCIDQLTALAYEFFSCLQIEAI